MGYYKNKGHFFNSDDSSLEHRAKYGTANSVSQEKGTDGKKNNTSEYNHEYYMKNKEKWKGTHSEYTEGDKDFDESNYSEKNRLGDTDFYGFQKEDGSWVILEEDMKFTIPAGMSKADIIKRLEAFDKEVEAKRQKGEKFTSEDWVNGAKNALRSKDDGEKEFDVEAAARDVISGKYKNGAERKAALGDDYAEVQKKVNELLKKGGSSKKSSSSSDSQSSSSSSSSSSGEKRDWSKVKSDYYGTKKVDKSTAQKNIAAAQKKGESMTKHYSKQAMKTKKRSSIVHFDENGAIIRYFKRED